MPDTFSIAAATSQLPATLPPRISFEQSSRPSQMSQRGTEELRTHFTRFVGEAFFGQMIKAMRATTGKPAYFYGGRAEEVFQGQLDQKLAEHLTEASADKIAQPMFERQFPKLTDESRQSHRLESADELARLEALPRR